MIKAQSISLPVQLQSLSKKAMFTSKTQRNSHKPIYKTAEALNGNKLYKESVSPHNSFLSKGSGMPNSRIELMQCSHRRL